jgi:hypothetical protein
MLADAGFLCDEAAVLRDTKKGKFCISSDSKVVFVVHTSARRNAKGN